MESFRDHLQFLRKKSLALRIDLLKATNKAQFGHTGSSLSAVDILVALYYGKFHDRPVMQFDPQKPGWDGQDYFVLSKGHACPALYAVLADLGFFGKEELNHLFQMNSLLQGHPVKKIPGVVLNAGSLAHGLSGALGLAMALKADRHYNRVFCLLGDGELQEGQVWEAAMAAAHYKLDNLVVIVDDNGLQIEGPTRSVMNVDPMVDKFESFGWKTVPVRDGHNFEELLSALERAIEVQRRPSVIVAKTVKGKGVSFAENKSFYHGVPLSDEEMAVALPALEQEKALLDL
ncbi:MAG: transketolase [Candidatus Gracilibacteria bacterium]